MSQTEIILNFIASSAAQFKELILPPLVEYCCPFEMAKFDEAALLSGAEPNLPNIGSVEEEFAQLKTYMEDGDAFRAFHKAVLVAGVMDYLVNRPSTSKYDIAATARGNDNPLIASINSRFAFASKKIDEATAKWNSLRQSTLSHTEFYNKTPSMK